MPGEQVYQRQVADRAGAPLPSSSAESYGAGLAGAVGQVARQMHVASIQDHQVQRRLRTNAEASIFQSSFASVREDLGTLAREGRKSDAPGHAERMAAETLKRREELLAGITDEELRQRAGASFDGWSADFRNGEADYETLRQGELTVERWRDGLKVSANRTRRLDTSADYASELKVQSDAIGLLDVSDKVKAAMQREMEQELAIAFLRGATDRDPAGAKAMLDSPAFDGVLTPDQVEALRNGADVEIRRAEAAGAHAAAVEKADFRESLKIFDEQASQGIDQSDAIPALIARATKLDLPDVVARLQGEAADAGFARAYQGIPPVRLEQRLATINARGDKATVAEQRERAWIEKKLPGIEGRYASDPVGFYAREGGRGAPPAFDLSDPASIQARARWARASGTGTPFSKAETAALQQQYRQGRQGEEAVIAAIHAFPADQAMAAARAIDPADRTLPIIVTLDPNHQALARRGREALKANPKLISDRFKDDPDLEEEDAALRQRFDRALVALPPEQRQSILATAIQLAAGAADKNGAYGTRVLENAINTALGAKRDAAGNLKGGIQRWGDGHFLAPPSMTAQGFFNAAQRAATTGQNRPVHPDGSAANLSRTVPVAVAGGWYEFRTASGQAVKGSDGKVWRIRPRQDGAE